jgi:hypothetical protein
MEEERTNKYFTIKGREEIEAEVTKLKETIEQHKNCLRDKDRRIDAIEGRYKAIKFCCIISFIFLCSIGLLYTIVNVYINLPDTATYFDDGTINSFVFNDPLLAVGMIVISVLAFIGLILLFVLAYIFTHLDG